MKKLAFSGYEGPFVQDLNLFQDNQRKWFTSHGCEYKFIDEDFISVWGKWSIIGDSTLGMITKSDLALLNMNLSHMFIV